MRRRVRITVVAAVVVAAAALGAFGVHALWTTAQRALSSDHCDVGSFELDTDQAGVAAEMVGEVSKFTPPLPERATVLVLAAGLQESKLTNIPPGQGDRDSVGVLQQRPSQGWGHYRAAPLTDVGEATREFLVHLIRVPHWRTLPLADAVQAVQISADGSAYAQHEPEAQALADALQGRKPAGITCEFDPPTVVARPAKVATLVADQLPINPPRVVGNSVRVPGAAWQTVSWFVANADRLGIDSVAYSGKRWTRAHGWQSAKDVGRNAVVATMAKL
jgi:hypothetical protein